MSSWQKWLWGIAVVWQFAIFAVGTLPAAGMAALTVKRYGGPGAAW